MGRRQLAAGAGGEQKQRRPQPLAAVVTDVRWRAGRVEVESRDHGGSPLPTLIARDAIIADVTPPEMLGRAFGFQRSLDHAGAVLGPIAAWLLLSSGVAQVRGVIAASLIPGIAVLVLAIWAVRDGNQAARGLREGGTGREDAAPLPPPAATSRLLPPALIPILAFYLLRMPETLFILRSQQLGVGRARAQAAGER